MFFPQKPTNERVEPFLNEEDSGFAVTQPIIFLEEDINVSDNILLQKRYENTPSSISAHPIAKKPTVLRAIVKKPFEYQQSISNIISSEIPEKENRHLYTENKFILRNKLKHLASGASRLIGKTKRVIGKGLKEWENFSEREFEIAQSGGEKRDALMNKHYTISVIPENTHSEKSPQKNRTPDTFNFQEKLGRVDQNTEKLSKGVIEKLQPFGKKLLTYLEKSKGIFSNLEKGAYYLDKNVDKKVKIFASASLIAAGTFASFAAPAVLTAIGAAGIGMRIVSAAGTYKLLNGAYKKWEENHQDASPLKRMSLKTGTIVGAAFMGQIAGAAVSNLGELFEKLSPLEVYEKGLQTVKDILPPSYEPIEGRGDNTPFDQRGSLETTIIKDITKMELPQTLPQEALPPSEVIDVVKAPETHEAIKEPTAETVQTPELLYEMKRGDSLWSALRKTLTGVNFQEFSTLSSGAQEQVIRSLISKIEEDPAAYGIKSGNIHLIRSGDVLDFTKVIN